MHSSCMTKQIVSGLTQELKLREQGGAKPEFTGRCGQCWTSFLGEPVHKVTRTLDVDSGDEDNDDADADCKNELWRRPAVLRRQIQGYEYVVCSILRGWRFTSPSAEPLADMLLRLGRRYMQAAKRRRRIAAADGQDGAHDEEETRLVHLGRCALAWGYFAMGTTVAFGCYGVASVFASCGRPSLRHLDAPIMRIVQRYLFNIVRLDKIPVRISATVPGEQYRDYTALGNARVMLGRLFHSQRSVYAPPIDPESPLWGELENEMVRFVADTDLDRLILWAPDGASDSDPPTRYGDTRPSRLLLMVFMLVGSYGPSVWRPLLARLRAHPVGEGTWLDEVMSQPLTPVEGSGLSMP